APPSLSAIVAFTPTDGSSTATQVAVDVGDGAPYPEPQSKRYEKPAAVSAGEASCGAVSETVNAEPSGTGVVGATLGARGATSASVALSERCPWRGSRSRARKA